jgi:hypothetical protein
MAGAAWASDTSPSMNKPITAKMAAVRNARKSVFLVVTIVSPLNQWPTLTMQKSCQSYSIVCFQWLGDTPVAALLQSVKSTDTEGLMNRAAAGWTDGAGTPKIRCDKRTLSKPAPAELRHDCGDGQDH